MNTHPQRGLLFDELKVGATYSGPGITVTEEAIIAYASKWDMQPFHVDAEAAKDTLFGGLVASGLQSVNLTYLMYLQTGLLEGTALAGLGIDEIRFHKPLRPSERLSVVVTVHNKRQSSRRDRGVVTLKLTSLTRGEPCCSLLLTALVATGRPSIA